jgi:laccase
VQIQEASVTRLCNARTIVTANGQFPGPTVEVSEGDSLVVNVVNNATYNITIHWYVPRPHHMHVCQIMNQQWQLS